MSIPQALRRVRRAPGFALVVLLLVAGAVAVNATAFGALWALGYKAMPYRDGGRLLELRIDLTDIDFQVGLSPSLYAAVRARSETFAGAVGTAANPPLLYDEHARPDEAKSYLKQIKSNTSHPFYREAGELERKLGSFFRKLAG